MNAERALSLLKLHQFLMNPTMFIRVKSELSIHILLLIAGHGGQCELRVLNALGVTPVALRQHVKMLLDEGLVELSVNIENRRTKSIKVSEKSIELLKTYEHEIQQLLASMR